MDFSILNPILNPIFDPLLQLVSVPNNPYFGAIIGVFLIATLVAFVITVANKLLVDQDRLQFLQGEMKGFQGEMMKAQKSGDPKAMAEMQKKQAKFMELQKEMMFNSFKPMIVTFVPIILIFYWMAGNPLINHLYLNLPSFAYYVLLVPIFHTFYHQSAGVPVMAVEWLGWYILCSFAMSFVWRKLLGLKGGGM
ncbi:MAG: EMC3/TMCO1 family protein [Methanobacterium sp. ERen5]|nr:MAG: EMC3/TMCO1 family protein [Methanobacterium sp. ERen5]